MSDQIQSTHRTHERSEPSRCDVDPAALLPKQQHPPAMEPEPEQQPAATGGLGVDGAFTSNLLHHMVLQATGDGAEPSVLGGESNAPTFDVAMD